MKTLFFAVTALALVACNSKSENTTTMDTTSYSQTANQAQQTATQPAQTPVESTSASTAASQPQAQAAPPPAMPATAPEAAPAPAKHGDTVTTASGLQYIDIKKGKGASPIKGQTITVNYTGKLTNGQTFDSNVDPNFHHVEPFSTAIGVGRVIPAWDEGMLTMKVGGKRRLICPPNLAYGQRGMPPTIPPNSTLVFDVELLGVCNATCSS